MRVLSRESKHAWSLFLFIVDLDTITQRNHFICIYCISLITLSTTGDHPPITPVALALPHELHSSDSARIYDLVVRHFLASISPDAVFQVTKAKFSAPLSKESFTLHGKKELREGFLGVYRTCVDSSQVCVVDEESSTNISSNRGSNGGGNSGRSNDSNSTDYSPEDTIQYKGIVELPTLEVGVGYRIVSVKMRQGATKPPGM